MLEVTVLVVFGALPLAVLGQVENCTIGGEYQAQDGVYTVQALVTCEETGLRVTLQHNYDTGTGVHNAVPGSLIQLFYRCENQFGTATGIIAKNFEVDDFTYSISLSSSFTERGGSCRVYGCYDDNHGDKSYYYYPILTDTCSYTSTEPVLPPKVTPPTTPSPSSATIINLLPTSTTSNSVSIPVTMSPSGSGVSTGPITSDTVLATASPSSTAIQSPTITPSDTQSLTITTQSVTITPSVRGTQSPIVIPSDIQQSPTPTPVPSSPENHDSSGPALPIVLTISTVMVTAISIVVIVLLMVLLRARDIQRKKNNILRYYNYSEPIDPDFNPVDFAAEIKTAVSVVSVFDTLAPYYSPGNGSDDDKSEVIQVFKPVTENVSVRSMVFHNEEQGDRREPETDGTDQEETKSVTKEPAVVEPTPELSTEIPLKNGYVPGNFSPANTTRTQQASSPVPSGYVLEKKYQPPAIPVQTVQPSSNSVWHEDTQRNMTLTWNQTKQIRPQLPSSSSSGYVSELKTPSDYQNSHPLKLNVGVAPRNPRPRPRYDTTNNIYSVVTQRCVAMETMPQEEDSNSVVYNLEECVESVTSDYEGVESDSEGVQSVWERMHIENIMTECSLSLNPLHFEPVDDPLPEQTTSAPMYMNTSDQFLQSPSTAY